MENTPCHAKLGGGNLVLSDLMSNDNEQSQGNKIMGIVLGLVTNNQDPEKMGRVKVKFPWFNQQYESEWARVSTFMAGKERGAFFLPEVGDEVIVAFDNGDICYPYVIGSLWNGIDKPPESNSDGKNNIRKIKSRSGHEIIFDDSQKKEKIEIHTKAGHDILLDDSAGEEKIEIKDKTGDNSIQIDSVQNSMKILSKSKISIKAGSIEIESNGMMSIKAGAALTIKGATVNIN